MTQTYEFPPGVLFGAPFTDAQSAVEWLHAAAHAKYPGLINPAWTAPMQPVLVTEVPNLVFTDPADPTGVRAAWTAYEMDSRPGSLPGDAGLPLDLPAWVEMPAWERESDSWDFRAGFALDHWMHLRGIEDCLRRSLPAAKSRRDVARVLGLVEDAVDRCGALLLTYCNGLTSALWRESLLRGLEVHPPNPYTSGPDRGRNNGVGTPRLGSPME